MVEDQNKRVRVSTALCCLVIAAIEARHKRSCLQTIKRFARRRMGRQDNLVLRARRRLSQRQTLAAGHGPRIELFCSGMSPGRDNTWTKDGLPQEERGRDSGLHHCQDTQERETRLRTTERQMTASTRVQ